MNKIIITSLIIVFSILSSYNCYAQKSVIKPANSKTHIDSQYLSIVPPVDIPIFLSGTFGELRSDHFHSGIDIKTQGVQGKNIIAIDDGWVSRIKISTGGYGKAIYITHPSGYVSVYGHLKKFNDSIQKIVLSKQYEKESYTVQIFPKINEIPVKKGEIIALSGNTGGSFGPHLHFEIRKEKSQHPVNPLFFEAIKIQDYYRPKITKLAIYPIDKNSTINGKNDTAYYDIEGWGLDHRIKNDVNIRVSGRVSFGISTYDLMNKISNKNGVYRTNLFHDTSMVFSLEMNNLSFNTTRYINSLIDYSYFKKTKRRIVRTQVDTNNLLTNYLTVKDNGIINFSDTLTHNMYFEVKDAYGNTAKLIFKLESNTVKNDNNGDYPEKTTGIFFSFSKKNAINKDSIKVVFPANSFYRSFFFDYNKFEKDSNSYSATYQLHNQFTPVHKRFNIKILTDSTPSVYDDKIYIAYSPDNSRYYFADNKKEGDYLKCSSRKLGYYKVSADTVPPIIKEVNFSNNKKVTNQRTLKIKINDEQTGIKTYRATLNNNWILMEYDAKRSLLTYSLDNRMLPGKNNFKLIVTDLLNNTTEYNCVLIY